MVQYMKISLKLLILLFLLLYIFNSSKGSFGLDTITSGQPLYGNQSVVSNGGQFELGFFSPGNSTNFYVGIWYKKISVQTVVWVANREAPIHKFSNKSRLELADDGNLEIFNDLNETIWAVNSSVGLSSVPNKGVLLDNGNFVLSDGVNIVWQSLDYPTDTCLPVDGKIGIDESLISKKQLLTSWKNANDPGVGDYSFGMDTEGSLELFMWRHQSGLLWRSGVWNNQTFGSFRDLSNLRFIYHFTSQAKYFTYFINKLNNVTYRYTLSSDGELKVLLWVVHLQIWQEYERPLRGGCDYYSLCGAFGLCNRALTPNCQCYEGFEPRSPQWELGDWSGGCNRTKPLHCSNNNGFRPMSRIFLPANSISLDVESAQVCQFVCSANCSCTAYAYNDGRCLIWTGDLVDTQVSQDSQGKQLFVKSSEVLPARHKKLPVAPFITIPLLVCILLAYCLWRRWRKRHDGKETGGKNENLLFLNMENSGKSHIDSSNTTTVSTPRGEEKAIDLPQFSFSSICAATNNFSLENKIGEGGFGPVYKGKLFDGNSVAVKRLSKTSGQGLEELRNETVLIAKLQHKNLVRLLGCCIEKDEKILIYEYMPNKSLDLIIFDPSKHYILDWVGRVQIIQGIAQGLLYLHQYSRLRIVHRDLKASNILLDDEMNPKISDFGMARIFGKNDQQANTNRIVGTYGYMSPEYAMEGLFSIKSDVFAFGVLLLEILSGKKNTGFRHSDCLSLIGYAWELWNTEKVLELIDTNLELPSSSFSPLRFIHVGLLCVQDSPGDRPTTSDILAMFSNEHSQLASPKRPAYTSGGSLDSGMDKADHHYTVINLSTSVMDGR